MHRDAPSWAEFRDLIHGLLYDPESRLWRTLQPEPEEPPSPEG